MCRKAGFRIFPNGGGDHHSVLQETGAHKKRRGPLISLTIPDTFNEDYPAAILSSANCDAELPAPSTQRD
jgi:hypothetical protein